MVGGGWFPVTKGGLAFLLACPPRLWFTFLPPIPPTPFPGGEGGDYKFISPGASPPAPLRLNPRGACSPCRCGTRRRACPRRCRRGGRWRYPAGACLLCRPPTPPLVCFLSPIPLPALAERSSPPGKGEILGYFMQGASPPAPLAAEPERRLLALPLWYPAEGVPPALPARRALAVPCGGLPSLSPAYPAFSLLSFPHPPARARRALFPSGEGGDFRLFHARGFAPGTPCG